jgi:hypothetical protein
MENLHVCRCAAIFISPIKEDMKAIKIILVAFGKFSGLHF